MKFVYAGQPIKIRNGILCKQGLHVWEMVPLRLNRLWRRWCARMESDGVHWNARITNMDRRREQQLLTWQTTTNVLLKPVGSNAKTSFFFKILNKTPCCSILNFVQTVANVLLHIFSIIEERCKNDLILAYINKHLNWQPKVQLYYSKDGA